MNGRAGPLLPPDPRVTRFALLGDVQGHADELADALAALGADTERGVVPEGLVVVQVGDLVHKGPDSAGCVALADRFLAGAPGRWVQLIGNHEAQYLGGTRVARDLPAEVQDRLRRWSAEGRVRIALAIDSLELGSVLVTHSGMTRSKWRAIGAPKSAAEPARVLNDELADDPVAALAAGPELEFGDQPGVVWADACVELLAGWADSEDLPFSQVHGHSSPYRWWDGQWRPRMPARLLASALVDPVARHTTCAWPDGHAIVGIDPGFGARAGAELVPLVLSARRPPDDVTASTEQRPR